MPAIRRTPYPLRPLVAAGFVSLLAWMGVYVLFFAHTLWHAPSLIPDHWPQVFYPIENLLPWSWVHEHRWEPAGWLNIGLWFALAALLFAAWLAAMRVAERLPAGDRGLAAEGGRIVIAGVVCFSLLLAFSPGFTSQDLYSNIWYGKMAGVFGVSPYTHGPGYLAALDTGNWLQWVYWKDQPCVYGPAWVWPAAILSRLAQGIDGDIVTYLLSQRLLAAGLHIANTLLIWSLAGKLLRAPGARIVATLFYGWCPLLVWEFSNNAHNDVMMVFWVLVAVWCHLRGVERAARTPHAGMGGWWRAAVAALALAGLVKLTGFLLLPAYLLLLLRSVQGGHPWRQRAAIIAQAGALVAGLALLLYQPYWEGPATLQALLTAPGNERYVNSLGQVARFRGPEIIHALAAVLGMTGPEWSSIQLGDSLDGAVRLVLLALAAVIGLVLTWRVRDLPGLLRAWGWLLLAYLLIGAVWFWPWYLGWVVPIAALVGPGRLRRSLVLYTIGGMALYGLYPLLPPPVTDLEGYVPALLFGPVALYLAGCMLADARRAWHARRAGMAPAAGARPQQSFPSGTGSEWA